jgi:D-alanyl-D-alanine carboxypeptidase
MVKSANDVSTTIAEGIGGSVEVFASLMNREAARLGMRESHFVNPHGLPDIRQYSSARDLAMLGRALLLEFPDYQDLFRIGAIQMGKKVMANHNGLIGRYPGADGMKTGFICSSGFNVVASATRGGQRLIVVVMGSSSATERTIKAAKLFDQGFGGGGWNQGQSLYDLPASSLSAAPDMRSIVCGRNRAPQGEDDADMALPVAASSTGNSDNARLDLMAGGSMAAAVGSRRKLGPRDTFQPVMVWTGRAPGTQIAVRQPASAPAPSAASLIPASAQAYAPVSSNKPRPLIEEAEAPKVEAASLAPTMMPPARPKLGAIVARTAPLPDKIAPELKPVREAKPVQQTKPKNGAITAPLKLARPLKKPEPLQLKPTTAGHE